MVLLPVVSSVVADRAGPRSVRRRFGRAAVSSVALELGISPPELLQCSIDDVEYTL
jgi:hypothetical protein